MPARIPRPRWRRSAPLLIAVVAVLASTASASARPLTRPTRLRGVTITEYFPVPESWFVGRLVAAPGLAGRHRVDWLYSATGISMEGDGIGLDGRPYHIDNLGAGGWVTDRLARTTPGTHGWKGGSPAWRSGGYWRTAPRRLTFPLQGGGWSNGRGTSSVPPPAGISFAPGPSRPLRYYRTIAVDPRLVPLGSRVYVPAYRTSAGRGWFTAVDTGGAILGRHIDVYRPPPAMPGDGGNLYRNQRIVVYPPGTRPPAGTHPGLPAARGASGAAQAPKDSGGASPGR